MSLRLESLHACIQRDVCDARFLLRDQASVCRDIKSVGILEYDGGSDCGEKLLFHSTATFPTEHLKTGGEAYAIVTDETHVHCFPDADLIVLKSPVEVRAAYNVALKALSDYDAWTKRVYRLALERKPVSDLLDEMASYLNNPAYVADNSFRMIAHSGEDVMSEIDPIWRYHTRYGYLPYDVTRKLVDTGEIELVDSMRQAEFVEDTRSFQTPYICAPIMDGKMRVGVLVLLMLNSRFGAFQREAADFLASLIAIGSDEIGELSPRCLSPTNFISDVLNGTLASGDDFRRQMDALGWPTQGDYVVFVANTADKEWASVNQLLTLVNDPLSCAFVHDRRIVVVVSRYHDRKSFVDGYLAKLASAARRRCAVSEPFYEFTDLRLCYEEALFAMSAGPSTKGASRDAEVRAYDDVFLKHVQHLVCAALPLYPPIAKLKDYDEQNGSDLCPTLLEWLLERGNTAEVSRKMFLHRNTVNYRIKRIEEVAGIDLSDSSHDLRMLLSLVELTEASVSE